MATDNSKPDQISFTGASATMGPYRINGGLYCASAIATWGGGSVTLQRLADDGSTWLNAMSAFTANTMSAGTWLPGGQYQVAIATATAVAFGLARIPTVP